VKAGKTFINRNDTECAPYRFTVASNRPFKTEEVDFIDCVKFLPIDSKIIEYLTKGKEVVVTGAIQTGTYEVDDGQGGKQNRKSVEISVQNIQLAGGKKSSDSTGPDKDSSSKNDNDSGGDDLPF